MPQNALFTRINDCDLGINANISLRLLVSANVRRMRLVKNEICVNVGGLPLRSAAFQLSGHSLVD